MALKDPLPNEILLDIFQRLHVCDIKNVRLVSKRFNSCGSAYLVRSVYISALQHDQEVLKAISEHPIIAKHVTELVYCTSMFDEIVLTDDFKSGYSEQVRRQLEWHGRGRVELNDEELAISYERYRDYCREQQNSIKTGSPWTFLAAALPMLPQLQHVRVVAGWKSLIWDLGRHSGCLWDPMVLTAGVVAYNSSTRSRRWYTHMERCWMSFFRKIVGTIATTRTRKPLLSLSIPLPGYGVLGEFLGMPIDDLGHWQKAFCHLQKLNLIIPIANASPVNLAAVLQSAPGLEVLRLQFESTGLFRLSVSQLLGLSPLTPFTWTRLRDLMIAGGDLVMQSMLDCIENHAGSLRRLSLDKIALLDGSWALVLDVLRAHHETSLMRLEHCGIYEPLSLDPDLDPNVNARITVNRPTSEAIKAFLGGQGDNPFDRR